MDNIIIEKTALFFSTFKHQTYKKGEILIRADDEPTGIFYLGKGVVRVYTLTKNGHEFVLNIYKPYSFFPMSWAITNKPNAYFYEALEDVEIFKAPKDSVVTFIKENPDILYDLMRRVYIGMDGVLSRMGYLMSGKAYTRLIAEILISAHRFNTNLSNDEQALFTISERELAAQTGLTRETVSRELKILKDKSLLTFSKNVITISNIEALERELNKYA